MKISQKKPRKFQFPLHKTKIICTIGPASHPPDILEELIKNGMNIARFNFSFGKPSEHKENIKQVMRIADELEKRITILIDLPGSKIRIGTLESEPIVLKKHAQVTLTSQNIPGSEFLIPILYSQLVRSVSKGQIVYFNDGFIQLKVQDVLDDMVHCKVIIGGPLYSSKGVNIPRAKLFLPAVTKKDLAFVDFGLKEKVDTFGISFIRNAHDVIQVKEYAKKKGKTVYTVSKIERKDAVKNFNQILLVSDAIMIARGDLGLEIPLEEVPFVQKKLISKANQAGCPVITATQMLESMKENTRPTRAEVTDVANAILDGTDAVMLSEETALGKYPVETLKMMGKIAEATEKKRVRTPLFLEYQDALQQSINNRNVTDILSLNVAEAAETLRVKYILTPTSSGNTARRISRFKPKCWILAFSRNEQTCQFLNFSYGVFPFVLQNKKQSWHAPILSFMQEKGLVKKNDKIILTQRRFSKKPGGTDSFGILTFEAA